MILVVEAAALGAANQDVHFPMSVEMELKEEDKDSFRSNIRGKTTIPRGQFLDRRTVSHTGDIRSSRDSLRRTNYFCKQHFLCKEDNI